MKRVFAMMLAILMLVGSLALIACNDDSSAPQDKPAADTPSDTPSATPEGDEDEDVSADARLPLNLPNHYYDGATFHMVEWTANDNYDIGTTWLPWHEGDADEELAFGIKELGEDRYLVQVTKENGVVAMRAEMGFALAE